MRLFRNNNFFPSKKTSSSRTLGFSFNENFTQSRGAAIYALSSGPEPCRIS